MGFFHKTALKGLLNPLLLKKANLTNQERESIHELGFFVIPYLRLFFQGIVEDKKCAEFLKILVGGNKETFKEITNLFVIWFLYSVDRTILLGPNDLLEDQKVKNYLNRVWFIDPVERNEIIALLDNTIFTERQLVFCKLICEKLNDDKLLTTLMIFVSPHIFGNIKIVLSLSSDDLLKISY